MTALGPPPAPDAIAGLTYNREGSVGLSGPLLALVSRLDAAFASLAGESGAEPWAFTPLLAARDLRKIDYFSSFPHLVTLPASVAPSADNLSAFRDQNRHDAEGPLALGELAPIESVLAPAACYAVYPALRGVDVGAGRAVTTCGTCFRREREYAPLRRQWSFRMREIVFLGDAPSARRFLDDAKARVEALAGAWGLALDYPTATDPFFDPARSAKFLHQKMFPSKHEMIFGGELALGSFNLHRNYFGEAFGVRALGEAAHTACVAFGLERWAYAVLWRHGQDPANWPAPLGGAGP